jgi:hypothetical protein
MRASCLCALHGLPYATPAIVALAVRKAYPHRIVLNTVETERSMQWGSSSKLVAQYLEGVTPEQVVEDVLKEVEVPV